MGFWESIGGQAFVQGTIPKLTGALDRIADALEKHAKYDSALVVPKTPLDLSVYNENQVLCPRCEVDAVAVQNQSPKDGHILVGCSSCLFKWYEKDTLMTPEQLAKSGVREDALEAAIHMLLKDIWENECADGIKFEHLMMARQLSNFDDQYPDVAVQDPWDDDRIQFARLLCEIVADQAQPLHALGVSMNLPAARINEIFERAHKVWEASKKAICPPGETVAEQEAKDNNL